MAQYKGPLHERWDFIGAFLLPITLGVIIAASIAYAEPPYELCFNSECYSFALQLFKIPITVAATSLPIAGIVAAYHRSIETQTQIDLTIRNNTFANYIKHKDEFENMFVSLANAGFGLNKLAFGNVQRIYREIFPKNSYAELVLTPDNLSKKNFFSKLEVVLERCEKNMRLADPTENDIFEYFSSVHDGFLLFKVFNEEESVVLEFGGEVLSLPGTASGNASYYHALLGMVSRLEFFCGGDKNYTDNVVSLANREAFDEFTKKYILK